MENKKTFFSIEIFAGEIRSGKTLSMVGNIYDYLKDNKDVKLFSNIKLNKEFFPDYDLINTETLETFFKDKMIFTNSIFLIDETHLFLDSRKFATSGNKKIGYFLGQLGKRKNIFLGTTHFPHLLDFRLRSYCERWNYCRKGFIINNKFFKPIKNNSLILTDEENLKLYIQIKPIVRKLKDFNFIYFEEPIYYVKAQEFFKYYDTEELVTTT